MGEDLPFVEWSERMPEEAYRPVGEGACRAYSLDAGS
jgi:hypothetical protein